MISKDASKQKQNPAQIFHDKISVYEQVIKKTNITNSRITKLNKTPNDRQMAIQKCFGGPKPFEDSRWPNAKCAGINTAQTNANLLKDRKRS